MIHEIEINTDKLGFINVGFDYEYNGYDNYFELIEYDEIFYYDEDGETLEATFKELDEDVQKKIESEVQEWLIWEANLSDYEFNEDQHER